MRMKKVLKVTNTPYLPLDRISMLLQGLLLKRKSSLQSRSETAGHSRVISPSLKKRTGTVERSPTNLLIGTKTVYLCDFSHMSQYL